MKIKIIIILICFSGNINARWSFFGEKSPKPGVPYEYYAGMASGGLSRSSQTLTWKVTNGKIKDQNGNYTLTTSVSKVGEVWDNPISVIWDCCEIDEMGEIGFIEASDFIDINIQPCNIAVVNEVYTGHYHDYVEGAYLTLMNVQIRNKANVSFNGYRSVRILPGFIAEAGSKVRIYNEAPSASYSRTRSFATDIKDQIGESNNNPQLSQNIPNPSHSTTTVSCFIPDNSIDAYIQVYNLLGNLVMKMSVNSIGHNELYIDTSNFTQGMYIYSLIVDDQLIDIKRMIVAN